MQEQYLKLRALPFKFFPIHRMSSKYSTLRNEATGTVEVALRIMIFTLDQKLFAISNVEA
jgi:hypothetical protein